MNPPLRIESDRMAMIAGLMDGTVDCIATDHAPHACLRKSRSLSGFRMGLPGWKRRLGGAAGVA